MAGVVAVLCLRGDFTAIASARRFRTTTDVLYNRVDHDVHPVRPPSTKETVHTQVNLGCFLFTNTKPTLTLSLINSE